MAEDYTGGMLALVPDDAAELTVPGGDPADQLHLTLLYLGDDVTDWQPEQVDQLRELVRASGPGFDPIEARIIGHAVLNPNGGAGGTTEPRAVYLIGDTADLDPLRRWALWATTTHEAYPSPPPQHSPVLWHVTAGYGVDPSALTRTGPIRFSTLRLALGNDVLDVPLGWGAPVSDVKGLTFTPPLIVRNAAVGLSGEIAGNVVEGKALDVDGLTWVAEHCGGIGQQWATEMLARVEVKADMNMGRVVNDGPKLESIADLHAAIDSHGDCPAADRPARIRKLRQHAKRLGADHHTHARIGSLEGATTDGSKSACAGIEVKVMSPSLNAAKLREYWAHGEGRAKWAPGTPGDFKRLRRKLAKYVQNPRILDGLTANIHKLATGEWPGKNAHLGKKSAEMIDDEAGLHDGVDEWGAVFDEPGATDYLAGLETPTVPDGGMDLRADIDRLTALGATMIADPGPGEASAGDDGWTNLFDAPTREAAI